MIQDEMTSRSEPSSSAMVEALQLASSGGVGVSGEQLDLGEVPEVHGAGLDVAEPRGDLE